MKIRLLILFIFFLRINSFSQQKFIFTQYTQQDGLTTGNFNKIFKDNTGFLWLLGESDLIRFDGYEFRSFNTFLKDGKSYRVRHVSNARELLNNDFIFTTEEGPLLLNKNDLSLTSKNKYINIDRYINYNFRLKNNSEYLIDLKGIYKILPNKCIQYAFPEKLNIPFNLSIATDSVNEILVQGPKKVYWFNAMNEKYEETNFYNNLNQKDTSNFDVFYIKSEDTFYAISNTQLYKFTQRNRQFQPQFELRKIKREANLNSEYSFHKTLGSPKVYKNTYFNFTNQGEIYLLNFKTGEEKLVTLNKEIPEKLLIDKFINTATLTEKGILWIASRGMGLFRYDLNTGTYDQFIHEKNNPKSLPTNSFEEILSDKNGVIWVTTSSGNGLIKIEANVLKMKTIIPNEAKNGINSAGRSTNIRSFLETNTGYWVGTLLGIFEYNIQNNSFKELADIGETVNSNKFISSFAKDSIGNIWIGAWGNRLVIINPKTNKLITKEFNCSKVASIKTLFCDSKNQMWVATYGCGIYTINAGKIDFNRPQALNFKQYQYLKNDDSSISTNGIYALIEDAEGNMWAGNDKGLNKYSSANQKWTRFIDLNNLTNPNDSTEIRAFALDKKGNLWLGTNGWGIFRYNKKENNFTNYTTRNGLTNDYVYTLTTDNLGMIWVGTNLGISRFNPNDNSCVNFLIRDGIQSYEFNTNAALKLKNGTILMGGANGFNVINPEMIDFSKAPAPNIAITKFSIFDKEIPISKTVFDLEYNQNSFSFEFAALNFYRNLENKYAYKMEGVDKDWIFSNNRRFTSYVNLKPGNYQFRVKACNSDGVWNEKGTSIYLNISPPWWLTWWMYIVYAVITVLSIFFIIWWNLRSARAKAEMLKKEVQKATLTIQDKSEKLSDALKDIKDSITYALRIQEAILPEKKEVMNSFPESFILFKPKDIVSGDFYFFHKSDDQLLIAAADCTGHGVPGALMSMVGSERMSDAVKESNDIKEILSNLNIGLKTSLKQSERDESTRDGMDIALCIIDSKTSVLKFSGANRPLWIIRNGFNELLEIKATKASIGGLTENNQHFDVHEILLYQGDTFYIFTDGYADQFGGNEGKKLKSRKLKEVLLSIQKMPMNEQESYLDKFIEDWKAGKEQVDDILIIG
ncbi:MAG: two-component regulator propeller domain-containing protein, partial [Bacteroidota bacterium]